MNRDELIFYNTILKFAFPELQSYSICWYWETYGGSFLKGLAVALRSADVNNERKIRGLWKEEIIEHYDIILDYENTLWD